MTITDNLTFLFLEEHEVRAEPYSVVFAIFLLLIGAIVSAILYLNIRGNMKDLDEIKDVVLPIYYILLIGTLRYLVSFIDFLVWYVTTGDYSLNGYYETILWFFILWQFYLIVSHQNLIQISRTRIARYNLIMKVLRRFLITGVVLRSINGLFIDSIILEIIFYLIILFFALVTSRIIKIEIHSTESIINKIRLTYLYNIWYYFLIYFIAILVEVGIVILQSEGEINGIYYSFVVFFMTLTPIMINLSAYWAVFIPQRARDKYGLSNPKRFT